MPPDAYTDDRVARGRRFRHLAALRTVLAVGYLLQQTWAYPSSGFPVGMAGGALFLLYGLFLLVQSDRATVRRAYRGVLLVDFSLMVALTLISADSELGIPLLMFYFLIIEAALLHEAREVLLLTAAGLLFFAAWLSGERTFRFSVGSFAFMMVVGGGLAYYFAWERRRVEGRIAALLRRAAGQPESAMVVAVEQALGELAEWFKASRVVLAVWDSSLDYYAAAQYPPERGPSDPPPVEFDARHEWACLAGGESDYHIEDVDRTSVDGGDGARRGPHPFAIEKFQIRNAVGRVLVDGKRAVGRILLINLAREPRAADLARLREVSHRFADAARHLLVVRRAEREASERERVRIANDLHDGPLQSVISFQMRLEVIQKLKQRDPAEAEREFELLRELARRVVAETRTFVHRMRPIDADESSLTAGARRLVDAFQKESGVAVHLSGDADGELKIPRGMAAEALKIIREALHNVYKHAQATRVDLTLEREGDRLRIEARDDGRGCPFAGRFDLDELEALRLGPNTIKQRVRARRGALTVESTPGAGTRLEISLPLDDQL